MLKKYSDIIILGILWCFSLFSISAMLIGNFILPIQNYIGYALLVLVTTLKIVEVKRIRTWLGILLVLGTFNLIQFTVSTNWIGFGSNSEYGIQPICSLLLLFFVILNFKKFEDLLVELFAKHPQN
jgi:hypothetical protein